MGKVNCEMKMLAKQVGGSFNARAQSVLRAYLPQGFPRSEARAIRQ